MDWCRSMNQGLRTPDLYSLPVTTGHSRGTGEIEFDPPLLWSVRTATHYKFNGVKPTVFIFICTFLLWQRVKEASITTVLHSWSGLLTTMWPVVQSRPESGPHWGCLWATYVAHKPPFEGEVRKEWNWRREKAWKVRRKNCNIFKYCGTGQHHLQYCEYLVSCTERLVLRWWWRPHRLRRPSVVL